MLDFLKDKIKLRENVLIVLYLFVLSFISFFNIKIFGII